MKGKYKIISENEKYLICSMLIDQAIKRLRNDEKQRK